MTTFEPSRVDIEFLNDIDGGYIGLTKPKVNRELFKSNEISTNQALYEDGDYLPSDLQGWDKD